MSRLVPLTKRRKIINKTALEKTLSPTLQFVIQNGPQLFMTLKLLNKCNLSDTWFAIFKRRTWKSFGSVRSSKRRAPDVQKVGGRDPLDKSLSSG